MKMKPHYKVSRCWGVRNAPALPRIYRVLLGAGTEKVRWSVLMDREMVEAFKRVHGIAGKLRVSDVRQRLFVNI